MPSSAKLLALPVALLVSCQPAPPQQPTSSTPDGYAEVLQSLPTSFTELSSWEKAGFVPVDQSVSSPQVMFSVEKNGVCVDIYVEFYKIYPYCQTPDYSSWSTTAPNSFSPQTFNAWAASTRLGSHQLKFLKKSGSVHIRTYKTRSKTRSVLYQTPDQHCGFVAAPQNTVVGSSWYAPFSCATVLGYYPPNTV